jgi:hypothetical protein
MSAPSSAPTAPANPTNRVEPAHQDVENAKLVILLLGGGKRVPHEPELRAHASQTHSDGLVASVQRGVKFVMDDEGSQPTTFRDARERRKTATQEARNIEGQIQALQQQLNAARSAEAEAQRVIDDQLARLVLEYPIFI